jgi:hypothetical protein
LPGFTSRCNLHRDVDGVADGKCTLGVEELPEGEAVDQLHHDERDAVVFARIIGGDDVRMRESRRGDRFVAEARAERVVRSELGIKDLHRDTT